MDRNHNLVSPVITCFYYGFKFQFIVNFATFLVFNLFFLVNEIPFVL